MTIQNETFRKAYEGSYYTIVGVGGDLQEWKDGYAELIKKEGIGTPAGWIEFTGGRMNEEFNLHGTNAYEGDLHFLAFPLDGLDVARLALFKLRMGDRWFDDIVDNNARREEENA